MPALAGRAVALRELRAHMFTLREAFEGNLAYWAAEP
jgi:hypothetical protein